MTEKSQRFTAPSLDGVSLRAIHWGDPGRAPLVLLHGGGANAHWWDHLAPDLARHFRVVALEFRGHGASDHPESLKVGAFSDDLDALLEHIGVPDAILVGHSMGGHIALERAARARSCRGLVLIDVAWGTPPRARRVMRRVLARRPRTYATRAEAVRRFAFVPPLLRASDALRDAIAQHSVCESPEGRFGYRFDPRWFGLPSRPAPPLSDVRCPTLIVRGTESPVLMPDSARALAAGLPNARLVEIEGAGHHVHLDRPEAVLAALREFLVPLR
ncbi:MAG: alpha/beta hydrolase [Deltaproteobacteria bacterium]|nr:MAG: alpha/beta hydrolase [Deltaproteobacteria bacterium]